MSAVLQHACVWRIWPGWALMYKRASSLVQGKGRVSRPAFLAYLNVVRFPIGNCLQRYIDEDPLLSGSQPSEGLQFPGYRSFNTNHRFRYSPSDNRVCGVCSRFQGTGTAGARWGPPSLLSVSPTRLCTPRTQERRQPRNDRVLSFTRKARRSRPTPRRRPFQVRTHGKNMVLKF